MIDLIVLLGAEVESQEIYNQLEDIRPGKGDRFLETLAKCYGQLCDYPESGPRVRKTYRRLLVPHTNYGIYYTLEGRRLMIAAVVDVRQDPEAIERRLSRT
jgi:plasmid stabilization system protein ParE